METLTQLLTQKLSAAFEKCGYSPELGIVGGSDRPDLCRFQCNGAFSGAKLYHKAPRMIAAEVAETLKDDPQLSKIEAVGAGFINIDVSDEFLLGYVKQVLADKDLGIPQAKTKETIVLDYGGPNVAKPLHIGHMCPAVIGESLKRLTRATGRTAISDVHLGDWGMPIGLCIAELGERCSGDLSKVKISVELLNEIYPFASVRKNTDEEFYDKARAITAAMQNGDERYQAIWRDIVAVSVEDIKKNYDRLNISFDYWYGESDSGKYIGELVDTLKKEGLLYESDGALVVDVTQEDDKITVPPVMIKKSDGSNIYATTDLATIIQRMREFDPTEIWYVADSRQSLHFTQVFRCAKKSGIAPQDVKLEYFGFGTMNGADGKPYKTRDGGVMKLEEFYNTVYEAALERVADSKYSSEDEKESIAHRIAVATIKFGDLINHRAKDYIFDLDKFMASDGKTGSFLLYTVARINSILRKTGEPGEFDAPEIYTEQERDLLHCIAASGEKIGMAYAEKAPNLVCENAYALSCAFSKFYHDNHILTETDENKKRAWTQLCAACKKMLEKHLDLLGIETVDLM